MRSPRSFVFLAHHIDKDWKVADFVFLAEDPHETDPDHIKEIEVVRTVLVYCPESSRRYFGRLFADSFVALPRKTPGIPASRASLTTKIHPELTPRTSRTAH